MAASGGHFTISSFLQASRVILRYNHKSYIKGDCFTVTEPQAANQAPEPVIAPKPKSKSVSTATFMAGLAIMAVVGFIVGTRSDQIIGLMQGVKLSSDTLDLSSVQKTYQALKANFDGTLDTAALIDGASRGMVAAAGDKYTVFMDATEAAEFNKELSGEVTGVGAEIGTRSSQPTIIRVLTDSPAEKAGLKAGDIIIKVNDDVTQDLTNDQVASKIRGDAGTSVKITIMRAGISKEFTIIRAKLNDPSVRWSVQNGVGVITMTRFDADTASLARQAAEEFVAQGVKSVVLDLRDNGGGYLDAARDVASLWVDKDKVVVTEKRGDTVADTVKATGNPILAGVKTVVLVNGGSASASEIVSGALQDYKAATLIGEKTYGKGSVQQIITLADGRVLKVTVAKWYTPNGKNISKEGITPDKTVEMTTADSNAGKDPQMDAALEYLK